MNLQRHSMVNRVRRKLAQNLVGNGSQFSWSQGGEDLMIACYLPNGIGSYVDVGAGHPKFGSNSYYYYHRGWRGTLIEPQPQLVKLLKRERPCDHVIEAACGNQSPTTTIHVFDTWQLSTSNKRRIQELKIGGISAISSIEVPNIKLSELPLRADPTSVSFLSIDVEGNDLDVLESNNWEVFSPRVICIEDIDADDSSDSEIHQFLAERDYKLQAKAPLSSIYVHEAGLRARSQGM